MTHEQLADFRKGSSGKKHGHNNNDFSHLYKLADANQLNSVPNPKQSKIDRRHTGPATNSKARAIEKVLDPNDGHASRVNNKNNGDGTSAIYGQRSHGQSMSNQN